MDLAQSKYMRRYASAYLFLFFVFAPIYKQLEYNYSWPRVNVTLVGSILLIILLANIVLVSSIFFKAKRNKVLLISILLLSIILLLQMIQMPKVIIYTCLLYTSDAADE